MKSALPLLLIAFASAKAAAFQAKTDSAKIAAYPSMKSGATTLAASSSLNVAFIHRQLVSGTPVMGCNCPFCTQMRLLAG